MTTLTARQIAFFSTFSDDALEARFRAIGSEPSHRVKATGHVKLKWAKEADLVLAEQKRRRGAAALALAAEASLETLSMDQLFNILDSEACRARIKSGPSRGCFTAAALKLSNQVRDEIARRVPELAHDLEQA